MKQFTSVYARAIKKDGSLSKRWFVLAHFAVCTDAYRYEEELRKQHPTWILTVKIHLKG